MSLQVWLPLNGDLHNQGLDNSLTTISGTPSWLTYGKISNTGLSMSSRLTGTSNAMNGAIKWSVCFWFNTASSTTLTNNWVDLCGMTDISTGGTSGQFRFEACYGSSLRACSWHDNATNATINGSVTIATDNEKNTWHHACVTTDGTNVKTYKDGVLIHTYTTGAGGHLNGYFWLGETNKIVGCIQDFRLYDHALSTKEVEEIAKGLVLHYKLNNNGLGNPNLLPCGGTYIQNSPWTTTFNKVDGYAWVTNSAFKATPGKTYTISVKCDGTLANTHGQSANPSVKSWSFWLYISNSNTTKSWQTGAYDTPINLTSANHNYRKIGNTHVWTYTLSSTQEYISLRTNSYSNGTDNVTINWWNMKIEEGDNFTGWSPNFSNASIIYDSSGYNNNGTIVGSLETITPSPKYSCAIKFDGSSSTIKVLENKWMAQHAAEMTINIWVKNSSWSNGANMKFFSCTESGGFNCEPGNSGYIRFPIYVCTNAEQTTYAYKYDSKEMQASALTANNWNMVTFVYNSTGTKTYINGQLHHTYTNTSYGIHFNTNARLFLGCEANTANPSSPYYNGQMSDFRLYYTALTAEQVKDLYKDSLIVNGTTKIPRDLE